MGRKEVKIGKGMEVPAKKAAQMRQKAGGSNVGEYKNVAKKDFAGSVPGSFPINTLERAKSALKLAHNDSNPARVKKAVYAKYPRLKK